MRVLVVGKKNMLRWPEHVADAWRETGWETKTFFYNDLRIHSKIISSVLKHLHPASHSEYVAQLFRSAIEKFEPDVIMLVSAFFIPTSMYSVLENLPNKPVVIGWVGDGADQSLQWMADIIDKLYITDSYFVRRGLDFGWNQVKYLPLAFNPKIFYPLSESTQSREVVFVGNPCQERGALFNHVHYPVTLIGPKWKNYVHLPHKIVAKQVSLKHVANLYRHCHGVVNIKQGFNVVNGVNMRSFEAPACGALLLNDDIADIHLHFKAGEEILVYRDSDELNEYLKMMHSDIDAYKIIRKRGMQRAFEEHTYLHRIKQIITEL